MQVAEWNYKRNNTNFSSELELRMLAEEAQEFKDGLAMYFNAISDEGHLAALVELVDAWADYQFVLQGSIYKYLGSSEPFAWDSVRVQEKYMYELLNVTLGIEATTLNSCLQFVIIANNNKGTEKVNGKIQKGSDWVDPKGVIRGLLNEL